MSNIIKASESSACVPFGFDEIEASSGFRPCNGDTCEEPEVEETAVDPLKELEETIHERLLDAERRAQEIEREAYEQGYAQGLKDGTEFGRKSMLVTQEQMEALFETLQTLPAQVLQDYRNWLVASSMAITKHVIQKELRTRPQVLLKLVQDLLAEVESSQSVTLTLHPKDLDILTRHTSFTVPASGSDGAFVVKTDPEMERGGCSVESDIQLIDAGIDKRLARIEQELKAGGTVDSDAAPSQ
ncbi:MAG: FliH/SctL family protein [Syntrophobacteraceae bacterium]